MADKEQEDELSLAGDDSKADFNFGDDSAAPASQSGMMDAGGSQAAAATGRNEAQEEEPAAEEAEEEVIAAPVVTKRRVRTGKAPNNVYTVLTFVAFVALTAAVVIMWIENVRLTQGDRPSTTNAVVAPFHVIKK